MDVAKDPQARGNGSPFVVDWQLALPAPVAHAGPEDLTVANPRLRGETGQVAWKS